jgi:hypothetical protein
MVGDEQGGFGGDWSVGLNSASANTLADTEVLARFGVGLRALYKDVLREPVPDHLAPLVNKLKEREVRQLNPSDAPSRPFSLRWHIVPDRPSDVTA